MLTPAQAYREDEPFTLVVFDVRLLDVGERFYSERHCERKCYIEALGKDHFVLIACPGSAWRLK